MKKPERKVVIYCGERVDVFGGIIQLFKDKKGEKFHYTGVKGVFAGECYEILDEKIQRRPAIAPDGFEFSDADSKEYEAQKIVVTSHRASRQKAMKLKRPHASIKKAVDLLRPFYLPLSEVDRRRFAEYLCNEMSKRKRK